MVKWQDYLESQLISTGNVDQAMLIGKTDATVWAETGEFLPRLYEGTVTEDDGSEKKVDINEASILVHVAKTLKKPKEGLRINGKKYMPVRTYPNGTLDDGLQTVYFKTSKRGGCICVLNKGILIGTYDESKNQAPPACNFAVETLGRYLFKAGF